MSGPQDWSAAAQAQVAGGTVDAAVFMYMATDPVIRLWTGDGYFDYPDADNVEPDAGAIYAGLGVLAPLPALTQLVNGESGRVDFTLSGALITTEIASLASASAAEIRNVDVSLGFMVLGADLQPLSSTAWMWTGIADVLKVIRKASHDGVERAITLSCAALLSGRRRGTPTYWTPQDQRLRSADDAFCDRVPGYNEGATINWATNG